MVMKTAKHRHYYNELFKIILQSREYLKDKLFRNLVVS